MPTILSVTQRKCKGVGQRILSGLYRGKPQLTQRDTDAVSLRYLHYEKGRKTVPWEKISRMAGNDRGGIICNPGLELPQAYGLRRFEPVHYGTLMAQNAFFAVLRLAQIPPGKLRLALYDPCGQYIETARKMMSYCSQLRVLTEDLVGYRKAEEGIMESCGGLLLLTDHPRDLQDCCAILSPGRWMASLTGSSSPILFSGKPPEGRFDGIAFYQFHLPLPGEFRELCPLSLENYYFLAALYEQCRIRELGKLIPDACIYGNEVYSPKRLAEMQQKAVK